MRPLLDVSFYVISADGAVASALKAPQTVHEPLK